jgi:hypothetical protein
MDMKLKPTSIETEEESLCNTCAHCHSKGDGEYWQGHWEFYVLICHAGVTPVCVEPNHPDGLLDADDNPQIVVECGSYTEF